MQVLLRLLVTIVLGFSIGLGLYFGGRIIYQVVVGPGPSYDQRMQDIQGEVAQIRSELADSAIEINEKWSDIESLLNDGADRFSVQSERIDEQLAVLSTEQAVIAERQDAFEGTLSEAVVPLDEMYDQLQLVRAMLLLSRAQFWLYEANLGQASDNVESARAIIDVLAENWREEGKSEDRIEVLDEVVTRLDIALEDIRTQPLIAEDEIEIAWKLLTIMTAPENLNVE